ncbi:hypothetical protein VT84_18950 [Gemmata sp. SH-PL17]|uniref:hypothetical protein n=1 Tax=Gemmata sp. SH-PL17 TaxID=1630693 RepID=UPI00078BAC22|nr:hypothetical protein [Gemmata sp. SH-PL17]AMV26485.1 hypothetical protein VT84_18950 [Gemmata sp. SH-PL17]
MTEIDPDDDFAPPPPHQRFRKIRKVARWGFIFIAVIVLIGFTGRWQAGRLGQRQLNATTNRLDAEDPGWRLDAILAERAKNDVKGDDNAAAFVTECAAEIPHEFREWQRSEDANRWRVHNTSNHLPPPDAITSAETIEQITSVVRTKALILRNKRGGTFPLTIGTDPIATLLPHLDHARQVASLLQYDGHLAAIHKKNPSRGISSARATLSIARAVGDEPVLISQLVRIAIAKVASQTGMQVLAWSEPTDDLTEFQAELLTEADVPWFQIGMRGERGMIDKVFRGLEDGSIPPENAFKYASTNSPGPQHYAAFHTYKALLPGDRAKCLQICTAYLEASKLPHHEQLAAIKQIEIPKGPPEEYRYLITRLLTPACQKIAEAGLRSRADLLSAATCVACERFRIKNGRWPNDLTELTPTFLPAVPVSPFDGKLITYRVFPDRIAVYCFWANAPFKIDAEHTDFQGGGPGTGIGYRLWLPGHRGLPAEEPHNP